MVSQPKYQMNGNMTEVILEQGYLQTQAWSRGHHRLLRTPVCLKDEVLSKPWAVVLLYHPLLQLQPSRISHPEIKQTFIIFGIKRAFPLVNDR